VFVQVFKKRKKEKKEERLDFPASRGFQTFREISSILRIAISEFS